MPTVCRNYFFQIASVSPSDSKNQPVQSIAESTARLKAVAAEMRQRILDETGGDTGQVKIAFFDSTLGQPDIIFQISGRVPGEVSFHAFRMASGNDNKDLIGAVLGRVQEASFLRQRLGVYRQVREQIRRIEESGKIVLTM